MCADGNTAGPDSKVKLCFICRPVKCSIRPGTPAPCLRQWPSPGASGDSGVMCSTLRYVEGEGRCWGRCWAGVDLTALQTPLCSLEDVISFQVSPQSSPRTLQYSPKLDITQAAPQQPQKEVQSSDQSCWPDLPASPRRR